MKYHAFISYSHADKAWGDWLHKALETYKVPAALVGRATARGEAVPARVYPVFRDREELPTATDLGEILQAALRESRHLVVICSPRSAGSRWVNEEILAYKRLGRENRILALIVDGEPNAADGKPAFAAADECFPEALKFKLGPDGALSAERTEPIAADAREGKDGKPDALLKLLAGVLGVAFDELRQRDAARRRRRQRVLLAVSAALILLFASLAAVANVQRHRAEAAEKSTRRQIALADLRQATGLAPAGFDPHAQAGLITRFPKRPEALAHLARALRNDPDFTPAATLLATLLAEGGYFVPAPSPASTPAPAEIAHYLDLEEWPGAAAPAGWEFSVWAGEPLLRIAARRRAASLFTPAGEVELVLPSHYGIATRPLASGSGDCVAFGVGFGHEFAMGGELVILGADHGTAFRIDSPGYTPLPLGFSPAGDYLFVVQSDIRLYRLAPSGSGGALAVTQTTSLPLDGERLPRWLPSTTVNAFQVGADTFSEFGQSLPVGRPDEDALQGFLAAADRMRDLSPGSFARSAQAPRWLVPHPSGRLVALVFALPNGVRLELREEPWQQNPPRWRLDVPEQEAEAMFHPDGHLVFFKTGDGAAFGGPLHVLDTELGFPLAIHQTHGELRLSPDLRVVATLSDGDGPSASFVIPRAVARAPDWLADLAEGMGGMSIQGDGLPVALSSADQRARFASGLVGLRKSDDALARYLRPVLHAPRIGESAVLAP